PPPPGRARGRPKDDRPLWSARSDDLQRCRLKRVIRRKRVRVANDEGVGSERDLPDGLVVARDRVGKREARRLAAGLDRNRLRERADLAEPSRNALEKGDLNGLRIASVPDIDIDGDRLRYVRRLGNG